MIWFLFAAAFLQEPVEARAAEAASIVREAGEALGGVEALQAAEGMTIGFEGEARFHAQGPAPSEPGLFDYHEIIRTWPEERQLSVTSGFSGMETSFSLTRTYDGALSENLPTLAAHLRQSPHAIVRAWLDAPEDLLNSESDQTHHRVSGVFYGDLLHVWFDRETGLPVRAETPYVHLVVGDSVQRVDFLNYADQGDWRAPEALRVTEGGKVVFELPYLQYAMSVERPEAAPESESAEAEPETPEPAPVTPGEDTFLHRDYAEGVRVLFNTAGEDYHSLAVASDAGVVVIEAPGETRNGQELAERAAELGEVRYVGATHHHDDHSGGIAGAVTDERVLVAAELHRDFFETMLAAERKLLPFAFTPPANAAIETVPAGGSLPMLDRVIAYDAGPNAHSRAHLVFYVPEAKLLFQSDMVVFRWDGSVYPARTQTCTLRAFIDRAGLEVETIVGGHGRPGTLADLDAAIALREEPCPQL